MSDLQAESQPLAQPQAEIASRPRPPASRRRDKPQLSCNLCRRRKLRCDRRQPCTTCSKNGHACTYPAHRSSPSIPGLSLAASIGMHDRVVQLERLVMSLIPDSRNRVDSDPNSNRMSSRPEDRLDEEHTSQVDIPVDGQSEHGSLRISASDGVDYVGGDHWAAILDNIADLKDHFDQEEQARPENNHDQLQFGVNRVDSDDSLARPHALLLYGGYRPASHADIIAALPQKEFVDLYISQYFNYQDLVSSIVHGPTFLDEYKAFWVNSSNTSIMWVGLLFSIICLAISTSCAAGSVDNHEAEQKAIQIDVYREKVVQCLILGEYTKSGTHTLETLIHYIYVEFINRTDADKDIWFLLGIEVNLAMRMGCHRDPRHFPSMTPFESEMRRRVWATVLMSDVLISNQMGMPRMVSDSQCDTAEPRNLNDADFGVDTVELPPPQPETEYTQTLGLIARRRMVKALGAVMDLMADTGSYNYSEVMRVDGLLQEASANIPPPFMMKSMSASLTDSPQIIMARLFVNHMFLRAQIMLHRRFLHKTPNPQDENTFAYSRITCLNASLNSLHIQQILDRETSPNGQLYIMRWRVTSIINHQFLAATMILCSLLDRDQTLDRKEEIVAALQCTRDIWARNAPVSEQAKRANETVTIVLKNVEAREPGSSRDIEVRDLPLSSFGTTTGVREQPSRKVVDIPSLEDSTLFDDSGLDFGLGMDTLDDSVTLNEWALATEQGTGWWY